MLARYRKLWWALYAGLLSLYSMNLWIGDRGLLAQRAQQEEINVMLANYHQLSDLQMALEAIQYDRQNNHETMILEARKIGFFREGERLLIVQGLDNIQEQLEVGYVIRYHRVRQSSTGWMGSMAFIVGFCLVLMAQLLSERRE